MKPTEHDPHNPNEDESALFELFDATAEEPSPDALARMARAAATIPDAKRPWYRQSWFRWPALAGALAGAAAVAALALGDDTPPNDQVPVATHSPSVSTSVAPRPVPVEDADDELLAFDITDEPVPEMAALDADPLSAWANDDDWEHDPMSALDLLVGDVDDVELVGAFDDVLTEGG